jgi:protein-tyrosine phosphatase
MTSDLAPVNWVELEGSVNVRDVGGVPTVDGSRVRRGVLLRSANLQHLTGADIRMLREDFDIRKVVDLRTDLEVHREGPGPMHAEPAVVVHHLSLYPDTAATTTDDESSGSSNVGLLSEIVNAPTRDDGRPAEVAHYLNYLLARPDSVVAAFRAVAEPGGTIVHCAAGKDRTGVVVALILSAVGVAPEPIAADYAATELALKAIAAHLLRSTSEVYNREMMKSDKIPAPSAELMLAVLQAIEEDHGGISGWLAEQGWTSDDQAQLRRALVED